jgi:PEGA domain
MRGRTDRLTRPRKALLPALALFVALFIALGAWGSSASARGLAIFRIDPLGVDPLIVARLEGLLRIELSRLADASMPGPAQIQAAMARQPSLQNCTGEVSCLVTLGTALGVDRVISGNVGGLAGSYVVNLKIVDVKEAKELRRIQEPISGRPDQLIEAVRVAAYGLVAPERLRGAIVVLADQPDATILLNGKPVGKTPLPTQHGLAVGTYILRASKDGYTDAVQKVRVRFQKTAQVVVKLKAPKGGVGKGPVRPVEVRRPYPWYTRWWFWTAVGVVAAGVGVGLGYAIGGESTGINCTSPSTAAEKAQCGL